MKPDARLSVGARDAALFASDMHLGDHDPDTAAQFLASLDAQAASITHLFLLGDIFEAWVGDDQPDSVAALLAERLRALSGRGVRVALMRGNRDFLLGVAARGLESWPARAGALMLDEPSTVDLFGTPVLLAHGDAWCTDDLRYQQFRAQVRSPEWQQAFLAKPLAERLAIARAMREQSERNKLDGDIGDVNEHAVWSVLDSAGVRCVIHGHTHRPGRYRVAADRSVGADRAPEDSHRLDWSPAERSRADSPADQPAERWVLPDWLAANARGGWLRVDAEGFRVDPI